MKHTPGPWTVAPGRDKTHPHNVESRSPDCEGFDLARCVLIDDARLIAAAPDLLAALQYALERFECIPKDRDEYGIFKGAADMARAAIAKAEGQA